MEIKTFKKNIVIKDFDSWKEAFSSVDSLTHWKEGYSAESLARHFTKESIKSSMGELFVKKCLSTIYGEVSIDRAEIERKSSFDKNRNSRTHDLAIWAESSNTPIVVCIEAKVKESFGLSIGKTLFNAKTNTNSKIPNRIENLCEQLYGIKDIKDQLSAKINDMEISNIMYQLLHYLAGSLEEGKQIDGDVFMPVFVYHAKSKKETSNQKKYYDFIKSLDFICSDHSVDENNIYCKEFSWKGSMIKVYTCYIEFDDSFHAIPNKHKEAKWT